MIMAASAEAQCTEKGGSPEASRPCPLASGSALAGELLPLHVGPDLLGHVGRSDRGAAEHRLHGVLAALEVDRVPAERLLALRHVCSSREWVVPRRSDCRGYYYHMHEGRET